MEQSCYKDEYEDNFVCNKITLTCYRERKSSLILKIEFFPNDEIFPFLPFK